MRLEGRLDRVTRIAAGSIGVGIAVLALKAVAWWVTGSAALYSDALETVVNVLASAIALVALRFAARPADENHPYGHDKAEFIAAVLEGVLIIVAAISILQQAWHGWLHPHALTLPLRGLVLDAIATVLNLAWAIVLARVARAVRSPALAGDARHLMADVVTSCGVIAGVVLVLATGQLRLDPLIAAATAIYVLWSGMHLIGTSVSGLMDAAPTDDTVARIRALVATHAEGALEAHDLRARHAGKLTFLQFHLVVPGAMRVEEAHAICDRIEAALQAEMSHLIINIHVEPESKAKHHGVLVL